MYYARKINVFYEKGDLSDYLQNKEKQILESIRKEPENYILNVSEEQYVNYLTQNNIVEELYINFDNAYAEQKEEMIPAEMFPREFYVISGKSYPKPVIYFHIPVVSGIELLYYTPSQRLLWTKEIKLIDNNIVFTVIQFRDRVDEVNREFENIKNKLLQMQTYINNDVKMFNTSLEQKIRNMFNSRKTELLKRRDQLANLVVPIKKSESYAKTFSIPKPELKKKIIVKPVVTETSFKPEPTLDYNTYLEILETIHAMGKEFERKPSVYSGKGEEQLRDHFLMLLEPNFVGSATGETFNMKGKTDILLRYEGSNVFIAECKFWKGKEAYFSTIDQLLNYLTWRDSKAAVILFVKNKDFTNVLNTVEQETANHNNYLKYLGKKDESWFQYKFHLNGDKNRELFISVMLYHIPKI